MSRFKWALVVGFLCLSQPAFPKDIPPEVLSQISQGNYAAAVEPLEALVKSDKKNIEAWAQLGWCYYRLERYSDAVTPFKTAYELKKSHYSAAHGYARALTELKDYDGARKVLDASINATKKEPVSQAMFVHDLGLLQLAQGRADTANVNAALLDSANTNFYIAIGQAPDSCQYRLDQGDIYFTQKVYPLAISSYEDVAKCDAKLAGAVNYKIARAHLYQREFKPAIAGYEKSLQAEPSGKVAAELGDAWILYSRTLTAADTTALLNAYQSAITAYDQAKKLSPNDCKIFERVGKAKAVMGKDEEAAEDFEAAIQCGSRDPNVLFALGNVLTKLARFHEALDWYGKYRTYREGRLTEQPWGKPDADFFANEAMVLRIMMDSTAQGPAKDSLFQRSKASYERALQLDSTRADIMDDLGVAYYQNAQYREAMAIFTRKIDMEPSVPNGYLNLAYCYLQLKVYDSVLTSLDHMLAVDSCNQKALEIGSYVALFQMQKNSLGRQWLEKRLACNPGDCDAIMYMGYISLATNDTAVIRKSSIPDLKKAYECRLTNGDKMCGEQGVQNAFWLAQAYMSQRELEQVNKWCDKVLACQPGHEGAKKLKAQAQSEY